MTLEDQVELAAWVGEIHLSLREIARHASELVDEELDFLLDRAQGDTLHAASRIEHRILDGGDTDPTPGAVPA